jgi:hypothetical protein
MRVIAFIWPPFVRKIRTYRRLLEILKCSPPSGRNAIAGKIPPVASENTHRDCGTSETRDRRDCHRANANWKWVKQSQTITADSMGRCLRQHIRSLRRSGIDSARLPELREGG